MKKNPEFSIIILTYNGEQTVGRLLDKLTHVVKNYTSEIILIDSSSQDRTLAVANQYKKKLPQLSIYTINKESFNHGDTRNYAVNIAKGEYICFFSQDVDIVDPLVLEHFRADFKVADKVVAVFGKQIPYEDSPVIQQLDIICWYQLLDQYTDKQGLLIQNIENQFIELTSENQQIWYFMSDAFICYKRTFLLDNSFPKVSYGEDVLTGEKIIKSGFTKVYDKRITAKHSHYHNLQERSYRLSQDFRLQLKNKKITQRNFLFKKIQIIFCMSNLTLLTKVKYLLYLFFDYFIKILILLKIRLPV